MSQNQQQITVARDAGQNVGLELFFGTIIFLCLEYFTIRGDFWGDFPREIRTFLAIFLAIVGTKILAGQKYKDEHILIAVISGIWVATVLITFGLITVGDIRLSAAQTIYSIILITVIPHHVRNLCLPSNS